MITLSLKYNFKKNENKIHEVFSRNFYLSNISTKKRIGNHNKDVISVLVGNLLGDGFAEKRSNATRFQIHMSNKNAEYIFKLHSFFKEKGYCSLEKPKVKKQIGKNNKVYFSIKFKTFSFSSFNYLYDCFYFKQEINEKTIFKKIIPENISSFLTEKAFAIWFMNDGGKSGKGYKLSTKSFFYYEVCLLQNAIFKNFNLHCNIQKHKNKFVFYFEKKYSNQFSNLVKPNMYECMYYKLH